MTFRWNRNDLLGSSPWHSRAQESVRVGTELRAGLAADAVAVEDAAIKAEAALRALPADIQHSIAIDICDEQDRPRFDYDSAVVLLLSILMAAWMTRAHLVGHQAGVITGILLAVGAMSAWYVLTSSIAVLRERRARREAA